LSRADHVEVEHGNDVAERHGGMIDEMIGAEDALFLCGERDEDHSSAPAAAVCESNCKLHQSCRT
jgi:hypothetical protein